MANLANKAVIKIKSTATYLNLLLIIVPLLNFLSGINIDLFAPSLPAISHYYNTSFIIAKNTITTAMIGFAVGCLVFGAVMDAIGRRRTMLSGLALYVLASLLALVCQNITQLMIIRFVQGMVVATVSIGCRAIVVDNFTGRRFNIALLYTSFAYGLGPILGPFIGGLLQYHFGWQANFLIYALFGFILLTLFLLLINESLQSPQTIHPSIILKNYWAVLKHKRFLAGTVMLGCGQFIILVYPTVGAFLVEDVLHGTPISYGYSALMISCGYLLGVLANRVYVKHFQVTTLIQFGLIILVVALLMQFVFGLTLKISLTTIIIPIALMEFALGFIFSNVMGICLKLFPNHAGTASAVSISACMGIAALGILIISHVNVSTLLILAALFTTAVILQIFIYFTLIFKPFRQAAILRN